VTSALLPDALRRTAVSLGRLRERGVGENLVNTKDSSPHPYMAVALTTREERK